MTDDLLFKEQKLLSYYFIDIYCLKMKKLYQMSKKDNEDTSMLFLVKFDTSWKGSSFISISEN